MKTYEETSREFFERHGAPDLFEQGWRVYEFGAIVLQCSNGDRAWVTTWRRDPRPVMLYVAHAFFEHLIGSEKPPHLSEGPIEGLRHAIEAARHLLLFHGGPDHDAGAQVSSCTT